ncbi:MAG: MFS transporter [candidate division Zixibacteria bacterium]|nr:MFS transporter [candidate division Zixibacteria bacterium]
MESLQEKNRGYGSIFRNLNFFSIWIGQTISVVGDFLYIIALMWWVLEKTGSTAAMATVAICSSLPAIILGPFAGTYVDRVDKRRLLILMDLGRGVLITVPGVLYFLNQLQVWHIFVIAAFLSSMSTFFNPALASFLPVIVNKEQLVRANSISQMSSNLSGIIGPALGGALVALFGTGTVMILDALSFFVSVIAIFLVRVKVEQVFPSEERKRFLQELMDGLNFIRKESGILGLVVLFSVLNFFVAPVGVLIPLMVKKILKMGAEGFGVLGSSISVGMVLGSLFLGMIGGVRRKGTFIMIGIVVAGSFLALFGVSESFWTSIFLLGGCGFGFSFANILVPVVFQSKIPHEKQGRVFGTLGTISGGLRPISLALVGVMGGLLHVQMIVFLSGVLVALGGLTGFLIPGIKKL